MSSLSPRSLFSITAWLLLLLGILGAGGEITLELGGCKEGAVENDPLIVVALAGVIFAVIGRILTHQLPENRIGWVLAVIGMGLPIQTFALLYIDCGMLGIRALTGIPFLIWLSQILASITMAPLFILLPAWFPDGKFVNKRWGRVLTFLFIATLVTNLIVVFSPGEFRSDMIGDFPIENPFGIPWQPLTQLKPVLTSATNFILILGALLAVASFVVRFRSATGDTRQQHKWLAYFLSTVIFVYILGFELLGVIFFPQLLMGWPYVVILTLVFGGFPIVIGISIFKYRLYDIDIIIRRTISYSMLTVLLGAVYFSGVVIIQGILGPLTGSPNSPVVTVITTLGIAALFNPLRILIQDFIDRRFYRSKYNAEQTLAEFAAAARDEVDIEKLTGALLNVVDETMQPEQISLLVVPEQRKPNA